MCIQNRVLCVCVCDNSEISQTEPLSFLLHAALSISLALTLLLPPQVFIQHIHLIMLLIYSPPFLCLCLAYSSPSFVSKINILGSGCLLRFKYWMPLSGCVLEIFGCTFQERLLKGLAFKKICYRQKIWRVSWSLPFYQKRKVIDRRSHVYIRRRLL